MIRIQQIKVPVKHSESDLYSAVFKKLHVPFTEIYEINTVKRSLDSRDKNDIHYVYSVDVYLREESEILRKNKNNPFVYKFEIKKYKLPEPGKVHICNRPVIVGSGPAGLFCAYFLSENGFRPILIERGKSVDERLKIVSDFWSGRHKLNLSTNVQFGEGGAGTFSDGKLNTGVNDPCGRNRLVLETFVNNGADKEILFESKPHVGTDALIKIVKNMRNHIIEKGGTVLFNTKMTGINIEHGRLKGIIVESPFPAPEIMERTDVPSLHTIETSNLILAPGHSARDTFEMLYESKVIILPKAFAVGVRIEHLQEIINTAQYGKDYKKRYGELPPADYKFSQRMKDGRTVYTFCMCPGGYVINASSENNLLCINGMSYSSRDSLNANSAIIVSITPEDTGSDSVNPLKGIEFQRDLEARAFNEGQGFIPVQRFGDFEDGIITKKFGSIESVSKGKSLFGDINKIFSENICADIKEAVHIFAEKIKGFDNADAVLSAVESRTSSPIRILRDKGYESNIKGIYPCGEGAGYAGGIMSAAIDGIKIFEEIYTRYYI